MELKGKALYNLLKINALDNPDIAPQNWQIEDLRIVPTDTLFERLNRLHLALDEHSFALYAEEADSPEDLIEYVWDEPDAEGQDRAYLLLFELWRRLLPKKQTLSIFCDELDDLIDKYDSGILENDEPLEDALSILEDILDNASDEEYSSSEEVFQEIARYCAHDLESFLYDYIIAQIDAEDELYASELIDSFYQYVTEKKWFDFLRARFFFSTESEESNRLIERLLEQLNEEPDVELLLHIINSLVHYGDIHLFQLAVRQTIPFLKTEKEFQELLAMCADYYRCLDKEKEEKEIQTLLEKRSKLDEKLAFDPSDKGLTLFYDLF